MVFQIPGNSRTTCRGVSEILGTILLVGVIFIILALVSPGLYAPLLQDQPPNADFRFDEINESAVAITFWNGNHIDADELLITVDGVPANTQFMGDEVIPSDQVTVTASPGQTIRVLWRSSGDRQSELLEKYIVKNSSDSDASTPIPTTTPTPTPTPTPPDPATFEVGILGTNSPVDEGEVVTVEITISNTGGESDTQTIHLHVEAQTNPVDTQNVTLDPGASEVITLEWPTTNGDGGPGQSANTYTIDVISDDDSDTDEVDVHGSGGGP